MDLDKLVKLDYTVLHQEMVSETILSVKETLEYRWFEYGSQSVQSLMNKANPAQLISPVAESLLLFLLFKDTPLNILNLGLGGASLERALSLLPKVAITSVEMSPAIIDIAKTYFNLPNTVNVVCQQAECFIQQTNKEYDVVICDLFVDENSPDFLLSSDFYMQLKHATLYHGIIMMNVCVDTEDKLLHMLVNMKKYFPYIALIDFTDYKNIIVIGSSHELPDKKSLRKRLSGFTGITFTSLAEAIHKMRYIPHIRATS